MRWLSYINRSSLREFRKQPDNIEKVIKTIFDLEKIVEFKQVYIPSSGNCLISLLNQT